MRRAWWIVVFVLAIMGGIAVWQHSRQSMGSYATFTSDHLKVRFDYPQGWTVREAPTPTGRIEGEVQVFGPRREDLAYSLSLDVAAESVAPPAGRSVGLKDSVDASLALRRKLPSYHILEQTPVRCAGQSALRLLASYRLPLPLDAAKRKNVELREAIVYWLRGGQLFRLTYTAPAEDFAQHQHAFERFVKSFAFLP